MIRVFDYELNILAEIDNYESLIWRRRWHKPGEFELHININKRNTAELTKGNIILCNGEAGIIRHREIKLGEGGKGSEELVIKGSSLSCILGQRITIPPEGMAYDKVTGNTETIMKGYIHRNCINPIDAKRKMPMLEIAPDQARGIETTYQTRLKQLDEELEKLSLISGLGWNIFPDLANKKWVFDVMQGKDLTAGQSINPPVIFAADFDAVKAQTFVESDIGHKNTAYVGGQGEGVERDIVEVGSGLSGLDRLETFVDARDLEQTADLPERGLQKLAEVAPVLTFDTEILTESPYKYGTDWDLGDIVTVQNRKWNVTLDSRITEVTEIYEPAGFQLRATFGSSIPTLPDRIKQELDAPLVEKGLLEKGDPGEPGTDGVGLNFLWDGTRLGVKREDEALYTYVDLEGPQGIQGPPGEKGADGKGLEFSWDGTRLGVRREGDAAYQYVDLKGEKGDVGPQGKSLEFSWNGTQLGIRAEGDSVYQYVDLEGPQGPEGPPGSDATVTQTNIEGALGYTPVSPTQLATKVDKVTGKGLSTEDYTTTEKTKLAGIESGANKYIHPASHPASMITESTSQRFVSDIEKAAWNAKAEDAHNHTKADITDMPTKLSEFENDIGAGAGLNIVVSPTEPAGLSTGDWWYKEV